MQRMLGHYGTCWNELIADVTRPLCEVAAVDACRNEQVVSEWNDTVKDYGQQIALHQLFETQVERTPDAGGGGV